MGPTNVALVNLFSAERDLRDAQGRLEAATKNVRLQQRRVTDASEKLRLLQAQVKQQQSKQGQLELDIRSRDAHIEKLRTQQASARNNKEYQAFLIEINTGKVDKAKSEEEQLKVMESLEKDQAAVKELVTTVEAEQQKLTALQGQIGDTTKSLQDEVARLTPIRDGAAAALPVRARDAFMRLADRYDGEALSPLIRPDRRVEEYLCTACHMELVRDVYNRLHSRDDLVFCTSCGRILYIPGELTPDAAVNKPKEKREAKGTPRGRKAPPAAAGRQSNASDVLRSIQVEDDEAAPADAVEPADAPGAVPADAPADAPLDTPPAPADAPADTATDQPEPASTDPSHTPT